MIAVSQTLRAMHTVRYTIHTVPHIPADSEHKRSSIVPLHVISFVFFFSIVYRLVLFWLDFWKKLTSD